MKIIEGERFKDLPTFYGAIIEDGDLIGFGHFKSNGFWTAGGKKITSYFRLEDGDEENPDAQYSRQIVKTDAGERLNFFFIEAYEGADFNAYIEGIKAQKEV